jgi:hypothetical protein
MNDVVVVLRPDQPAELCTECGHDADLHAYSDNHSKLDWMNDDGSINYATHCHEEGCTCPDWNGEGRPRAEPVYPITHGGVHG